MNYQELIKRQNTNQDKKFEKRLKSYIDLINALKHKDVNDDALKFINDKTDELNSFRGEDKAYYKMLNKSRRSIIELLEKNLKLVPKSYYRNKWLAIGMVIFGIPMGTSFGVSMGNMGMLGIGIPIGMMIGIAIGTNMDNKALKEGRQIDVEVG